jgi:hypothetical protein
MYKITARERDCRSPAAKRHSTVAVVVVVARPSKNPVSEQWQRYAARQMP